MAKADDADPVAKAKAALAALPEKPASARTVYEQVEALYPELVAARRDKHYTEAELVSMLETNGIKITLGTFQQYMRKIAKSSGEPKPKASVKPTERKANTNANASATKMEAPASKPEGAPNKPPKGSGTKPSLGFESKFDDE